MLIKIKHKFSSDKLDSNGFYTIFSYYSGEFLFNLIDVDFSSCNYKLIHSYNKEITIRKYNDYSIYLICG